MEETNEEQTKEGEEEKSEDSAKDNDDGAKTETTPLLDKIREENDRTQKLIEEQRSENNKTEQLVAAGMLGGKSSGTGVSAEKKEESNIEYANNALRGIIPEKK